MEVPAGAANRKRTWFPRELRGAGLARVEAIGVSNRRIFLEEKKRFAETVVESFVGKGFER
jgi:hypothetical protein